MTQIFRFLFQQLFSRRKNVFGDGFFISLFFKLECKLSTTILVRCHSSHFSQVRFIYFINSLIFEVFGDSAFICATPLSIRVIGSTCVMKAYFLCILHIYLYIQRQGNGTMRNKYPVVPLVGQLEIIN